MAFAALASSLLGTSSVFAQDSAVATQRSVTSRRDLDTAETILNFRTDATGSMRAPFSPGDSDLGDQIILMPEESYLPWRLFAIGGGEWTSNAALTDDDELDDFLWRAEVGGVFTPHITGNLFGELSANYEFFRYQDNSRLDFDSLEASAGLVHVFRGLGDLSTWGRYDYTRLTETGDYSELFTDHAIELGLLWPVPITGKLDGYLSHISHLSIDANPGHSQYNEFSFIVGGQYGITDRIALNFYYEFAVFDYHEGGREDLNHHVGLAATASLTENVDFVISGTYTLNDSNLADADYEVGTAGAFLGLNVRF